MKTVIAWVIMAACLLASSAGAGVITLTEDALLALDRHSSPLLTPHVISQEVFAGGVRFDIQFAGNNPLDTQLLYSSATQLDISDYDAYFLTFTFLSIDGMDPEQVGNLGFYVSPFIRDAAGINHFWELNFVDLKQSKPPSVTGGLDVDVLSIGHSKPGDILSEVGFEVRMESDYLNPHGFTLSLLVEPASGAIGVPEPATLLLLALGVLTVRKPVAQNMRAHR